jgi:hypothetical protein
MQQLLGNDFPQKSQRTYTMCLLLASADAAAENKIRKKMINRAKTRKLRNFDLQIHHCQLRHANFMSIHEIHRILSIKVGFQLSMLHIPNMTKAQGQCKSMFSCLLLQCQNAKKNDTSNFWKLQSVKVHKICNNLEDSENM